MPKIARNAAGEMIPGDEIVRKNLTLDRETVERLPRIAAKSNGAIRSDSAAVRWALALAEAHLDAGLGPADLKPARKRKGAKP